MLPPIPSFNEIPQDLRPGLQIASTGKTAGVEAVFPKATAGLGIAAFIGGVDNVWKKSGQARAARDAQNIASSYAAGSAAGCEELGAAKSVDDVINILKKGTRPAEGPFASSSFQVSLSQPTPEHRKAVMAMLELKDGALKYIPPGAGKESAPATPEIVLTAATATAKAKRNAQNIAAIFGAGHAAGAPEFAQADSIQAAVDAVVKGAKGGGKFSNSLFKVQVTKSEQKAAMAFLEWDAAIGLRYKGGK